MLLQKSILLVSIAAFAGFPSLGLAQGFGGSGLRTGVSPAYHSVQSTVNDLRSAIAWSAREVDLSSGDPTRLVTGKVAFIDSDVFHDAKFGITRIVQAAKGANLAPIEADIHQALGAYATQNGINVVFDLARMDDRIVYFRPEMDITDSFVAGFNGGSYQRVDVPAAKFVFIDTRLLQDEKTGIQRLARITKGLEYQRKAGETDVALNQRRNALKEPAMRDIFLAFGGFAKAREITLIFDASKIEGAPTGADATKEFIAEYNQRNP